MERFDVLYKKIENFVKARDWRKFHTPCNLSKSICLEAAELLECFQWDNDNFNLEDLKDELADVFIYCIQMSQVLDLDILEVASKKMDKNALKYPVEKAKSSSTKYDKL